MSPGIVWATYFCDSRAPSKVLSSFDAEGGRWWTASSPSAKVGSKELKRIWYREMVWKLLRACIYIWIRFKLKRAVMAILTYIFFPVARERSRGLLARFGSARMFTKATRAQFSGPRAVFSRTVHPPPAVGVKLGVRSGIYGFSRAWLGNFTCEFVVHMRKHLLNPMPGSVAILQQAIWRACASLVSISTRF